MTSGATMAMALAMNITTLSKSSSSHQPPSHVGSGGSAYAMGVSATTKIARRAASAPRGRSMPHMIAAELDQVKNTLTSQQRT